VELLQAYFRYTLNILHLKILYRDQTILTNTDIKHLRLNIRSNKEVLQMKFNHNI